MSPSNLDRWTGRTLAGLALLSGGIVLVIIVFIAWESWPALTEPGVGSLLTDERWLPRSQREPAFGAVTMFLTSGVITLLSTSLALPLGLSVAISIRFFSGKRWGSWQRRILELMAGIPSVVLGFWGLTTLVPLLGQLKPPGQSLLAGAILLLIMILPTVALTSLTALNAVSATHLRSAAALGLSRHRTILQVVLPIARPGILSGAVLAAARAVGETMAVVMVCGNVTNLPVDLLAPVRPVTSTIALEMGYATASHRSVLFVLALLLMLLIAFAIGVQALMKPREAGRA